MRHPGGWDASRRDPERDLRRRLVGQVGVDPVGVRLEGRAGLGGEQGELARQLPHVDPESVAGANGPSGRERLLGYHICDWLVPTRDLLLDRGMMGDGVIETGDDVIYGGLEHDVIEGGEGNDRILGQDGDDVLTGGPGDDTLSGGLHDDTLIGNGAVSVHGAKLSDSSAVLNQDVALFGRYFLLKRGKKLFHLSYQPA